MQKSEQLTDRSGRLSPKIVPNFVCRLDCRKAGIFSVDVLGIPADMLKGDMVRGGVFFHEEGEMELLRY